MIPPPRIPTAERIPDSLRCLSELALDLRFAWRPELAELFRSLDPALWEISRHNTIQTLRNLPEDRFRELAADPDFLRRLEAIHSALEAEDGRVSPLAAARELSSRGECVAYFSAEFGLTEMLPIYAGGLGVLAGDHLKSASDLGVPIVGVGLFYREGYFQQKIDSEGRQVEENPAVDPSELPVALALGEDGRPVLVSVEMAGRTVNACLRVARVGRVALVLLDSDVAENEPVDRAITHRLYGGNHEMRLAQELLLGVGGLRALIALHAFPTIRHLNEGHAAFVTLEMVRQLMATEKLTFAEARELARAGNIFTTHTPVPAGIDLFSTAEMRTYLSHFASEVGLSFDELFELGREAQDGRQHLFSMAVLAIRLSGKSTAVSRLHSQVSRVLWKAEAVSIEPITNGVHAPTWTDPSIAALRIRENPDSIDRLELWKRHVALRSRLIQECRDRLGDEVGLDPNALTIGFARRFATYKRATLLFQDPERLLRILGKAEFPVQFLFAGKAHPMDQPGKELFHRIAERTRDPAFRGRVVLLPNYDMGLARHLVSGCDAWLNNPERPLEASGTSGMKAAMNGVLNVSVRDGWWDEAPRDETGFTIGLPRDHAPAEEMAAALYDTLEYEVIPLFYERDGHSPPGRWVEKMIRGIDVLGGLFSADRMVSEYAEKCYVPAARQVQKIQSQRKANLQKSAGELPGRSQYAGGG